MPYFLGCFESTPDKSASLQRLIAHPGAFAVTNPTGELITVAVGTTVADRPRTDPYKRVWAYGSINCTGPSRSEEVKPHESGHCSWI